MALDKFPPKLTRIISSFITNRKLAVRVGSSTSPEVTMDAGTPQGSCLSPELYNYYSNSAVDPTAPNADPSQYADDTGAWASARLTHVAASKVQAFLNDLEGWCKKWRLQLAPEKTKVLLFTRCFIHKPEDVHLQLFGAPLEVSNEAKFLGVTFDSGMRWRKHLADLISKAKGKLQVLRKISALQGGKYPLTILRLFESLIRSTFEYGAPSFLAMAQEHWKKAERIQSEAARIALRLPRYTPLAILERAIGLPPLKLHLENFVTRRFLKILHHSPIMEQTLMKREAVSESTHHESPLDILERCLGSRIQAPAMPDAAQPNPRD